jgi:hypothetical protein
MKTKEHILTAAVITFMIFGNRRQFKIAGSLLIGSHLLHGAVDDVVGDITNRLSSGNAG